MRVVPTGMPQIMQFEISKYGGTGDEDRLEFLITYKTTYDEYEMSEDRKCRYIHKNFKDKELLFYKNDFGCHEKSYIVLHAFTFQLIGCPSC